MSSKELLAEYTKLAARLEHINETLQEMNAVDIAQLIDKIRVVERKMSLVYTLFKTSTSNNPKTHSNKTTNNNTNNSNRITPHHNNNNINNNNKSKNN
ncbi:hypothetical protein BGX24_011335 [Mortierella sp. AD032]|nr:hypothetical protein BGX24_011335 [Mortierella sp. AD032]